jgi:hypothetical protein
MTIEKRCSSYNADVVFGSVHQREFDHKSTTGRLSFDYFVTIGRCGAMVC